MEYYIRAAKPKKRSWQKKAQDSLRDRLEIEASEESRLLERNRSEPFPFSRLPPEIRNKVYKLLFAHECVLLLDHHRTQPSVLRSYCLSRQVGHVYEGRRLLRFDTKRLLPNRDTPCEPRSQQTYSTVLPPIHQVNKQLYTETISFRYSKSTFSFDTLQSLSRFMRVLDFNVLGSIRNLELGLQTYGSPRSANNTLLLRKSWAGFKRSMTEMTTQIPNITNLDLFLDLREWPLSFTFREAWVQPVLQLRDLHRLKAFTITISTPILREFTDWWDAIKRSREESHMDRYMLDLKKVVDAVKEVHQLFQGAVVLYVLGRCESCALQNFYERVHDREGSLWKTLQGITGVHDYQFFQRTKDWSWVDHGVLEVPKRVGQPTAHDVLTDPFPELEGHDLT